VTNQKSKLTKNQKFLRGLLFVSAGAFMLIRFAAGQANLFFVGAAWFAALVSLVAFVFYVWSVFEEIE